MPESTSPRPIGRSQANPDDALDVPRSYGGYGSYGAFGGYNAGPGDSGVHLVDYLRTIYRHRWIALTAFTTVFLYMAIQTYSTTPIYEGRVQLLVESVNPSVVTFKEVIQQDNYNYDFYPTQYAILKSRTLARRTLDAAKLWDSPEFGGGGAPGQKPFSVRGALSSAVSWAAGLFSSGSSNAVEPAAGETARQSRAIDAFLGRLTVTPIRSSRLMARRILGDPDGQNRHVASDLA